MSGFALVVDFAVFVGIVSAGVYLVAMVRDGAGALKTLGMFAGLGIAAPVLIAVANTIGMTVGILTWLIFPFMPPYRSSWGVISIAVVLNGIIYAALGILVWARNRRSLRSKNQGLGL